jgi:hypothetical protein
MAGLRASIKPTFRIKVRKLRDDSRPMGPFSMRRTHPLKLRACVAESVVGAPPVPDR